MINIVLNAAQLLVQCAALLCLVRIKRYLGGIDSGQEETNEYLSDIRKIYRESMEVKRIPEESED